MRTVPARNGFQGADFFRGTLDGAWAPTTIGAQNTQSAYRNSFTIDDLELSRI
jgi:hypothetical protein